MFTGLVQALVPVRNVVPDGSGGVRLTVDNPFPDAITLGESIAVNGCCLTVVHGDRQNLVFQIGPETLAKTTFGTMRSEERVNLERALAVGDRLGGHFVNGHIDARGTILTIETNGEWSTYRFAVPAEADELLIPKGSIAIDGISLTLVDVEPGMISVMLIPHTRDATTLGIKQSGDAVHLEFDMLAKHVRKLLATQTLTV